MLKAESTKYKMAMNMVLWKLKVCFNNTPGAVFKDFVCANLVLKKKAAEDERVALAISTATAAAAAAAAAIVLPAPRGGLFGYFAPV
jgi:hypothetical protein